MLVSFAAAGCRSVREFRRACVEGVYYSVWARGYVVARVS